MKREVWQSYDCPLGADADLEGAQLVHRGEVFLCHWCHGSHVAGGDVEIETFIQTEEGHISFPELPATADDLSRLVGCASNPSD